MAWRLSAGNNPPVRHQPNPLAAGTTQSPAANPCTWAHVTKVKWCACPLLYIPSSCQQLAHHTPCMCTHTRTGACTGMCTRTCTPTPPHTHGRTPACTHTHTQTHTHTYTHPAPFLSLSTHLSPLSPYLVLPWSMAGTFSPHLHICACMCMCCLLGKKEGPNYLRGFRIRSLLLQMGSGHTLQCGMQAPPTVERRLHKCQGALGIWTSWIRTRVHRIREVALSADQVGVPG
jgi:hypothetical protein